MTQRSNNKVCPICGHENAPGKVHCAQCDALLAGVTTFDVSDLGLVKRESIVLPTDLEDVPAALPPDSIALYAAGGVEPLVVRVESHIVLGRHTHGTQTSVIDLSVYGAYTLGVSREHAKIIRSEAGFVLEDLNSTNGTWLNGQAVVPGRIYGLQNGDMIQVGQLSLLVYFAYSDAQ